MAVNHKKPALIEFLMRRGADPYAEVDLYSPLQWAVNLQDDEFDAAVDGPVLRSLLSCGANFNRPDVVRVFFVLCGPRRSG